MRRLLVITLTFFLTSMADAGLWITVDGVIDPPEVTLSPGQHAVIGIWGDGRTPSYQWLFLIVEGPGTVSGGVVLYPGNISAIFLFEEGDGYGTVEWLQSKGYNTKQAYDIQLAEGEAALLASEGRVGTAAPPALQGTLVDEIELHCDDVGDVLLTLVSVYLTHVYDTQIIHQRSNLSAAHWKFDEAGGTTAYNSAGENHGFVHGAQWAGGVLDGALDFDGFDDYVDCGDHNSLNLGAEDFSIAAWIKPRTLVIDEAHGIVSKWQDPDNRWYLYAYENIVAFTSKTQGDWAYAVLSEHFLDVDCWHHVCFVGDYNELFYVDDGRIYIDGQERTDYSRRMFSRPSLDNSATVKIGYNGNADAPTYFDGQIDDVRIYKTALSAEDVRWFYSYGAGAPVCYVDAGSGDDGNNGLTPQTAFATIQKGVDSASFGGTVIVAPGTYTGPGNRDIDYKGKTITVRSIDPNDPNIVGATIIDCNGTESEPHRGFYFHSGEGPDSVLAGLTITHGWSGKGGAIYCGASSPTVNNCTFSGNSAEGFGGGMYNYRSNPTVEGCTFSGNSAGRGGGMYNYRSDPTVEGCTFSGNSAGRGGGMYNGNNSRPTVQGCTFSGNSAGRGGGMHNDSSGPTTVTNCILWADGPSEIYGGTPVVTYSDVQGGYPGQGNIDADPCFVNAPAGDYHLLFGSPCIDAGDPAYIPKLGETDIDGDPRRLGISVDMGADEVLADGIWITVFPKAAQFALFEGQLDPSVQSIQIANAGVGTLNWHVTEDCPWLQVNPTAGTAIIDPNEFSLIVDAAGMPRGTYDCNLTVSDPNAINSPLIIPVTLEVMGPNISLSANQFNFQAYKEDPNPPDQILSIRNAGGGTLNWQIIPPHDCNWLSVYPLAGQSRSDVDEVTLTVDTTGLAAGFYSCDLTIIDPNASNSPQTVEVRLLLRLGEGCLHVPGEYPTIQKGIDSAPPGGTVIVAPGTYTGLGNRDLDYKGKAITVCSTDPNDPDIVATTIIDCGGTEPKPHRGFVFASGEGPDSVLAGLTITNGVAPWDIHPPGFHADYGGAIGCYASSPTISRCIITDGFSSFGGGIACIHNAEATINNCTFMGNFAYYAGALFAEGSDPTISRCTFTGNSAYSGGAIVCYNASPTITNCLIAGNSAIGTDTGEGGGGILCLDESFATISHCSIVGNSALGCGGGFNASMFFSSQKTQLTNCIFWGNSANLGSQIANGYICMSCVPGSSVSYSNVQGGLSAVHWPHGGLYWRSSNIDADPCFVNAPAGDYHLLFGSPCIDAGDPAFTPSPGQRDLDGEPRLMGLAVDMGVDEVGPKQADLSRDGLINFEDFSTFVKSFDSGPADWNWYILSDLHKNNHIDYNDLAILLDDWLWQAPWYESP